MPPPKLTKSPHDEIPPFVPLGTFFKLVINTGSDRDKIPNSDAHVSPLTHAKLDIRPIPRKLEK